MFDMLQDMVGVLVRQSWQLVAIFAGVLLICALSRRASAHWRYLLWLLVLAKCLAPPMVTVPLGLWPAASAVHPMARSVPDASSAARPAPLPPVADPPTAAQPVSLAAGQSVVGQEQADHGPLPSPAAATAPPLTARVTGLFRTWTGPVWLLGVTIYFFIAVAKSWRLHRRLLAVRTPVAGDLQAEIQSVARHMRLRRCPNVFVAASFSQPFVWGLFRGSVYLPSGFAATTAKHRQAVLGHELAHVARLDAAVNALQVLLQGIFFFHPLIWWANRQVRREREKCCDEAAIAALSAEPRSYSQALVDTLINSRGQAVPVLAVAGPVRNLEERIRDIMRTNRTFKMRPNRPGVALVAVLGCLALAIGLTATSPTQAQNSMPSAAGQTQPQVGVPTVTMPDGTTVQLIAVTKPQEQPQRWWRADGEPLSEPPVTLQPADKRYEYAMLFQMPPYGDASETLVAGASSHSEEMSNGYRVFWIGYSEAPASAEVTYKRASGPWSTLATCAVDASGPVGGTINGVYFKPLVADNGKTKAELIYLPMPGDALRLEAVLKDGKRLPSSNWISSGNVITDSVFTFDAPPEQVARLELSTRPYDIAAIRHISLRPGEKTQPQADLPGQAALNIAGLEHRRVNQFVADFPKTFDLSTPEAAYASINRIDSADGWRKASIKAMAESWKGAKDQPRDPQWQAVLEHAQIQNVWIWQGKAAVVTARLRPQSADQAIRAPIDMRFLQLEDGQWRNTGNDRRDDEAQALIKFQQVVVKKSIDDSAVKEHAAEIQAAAKSLFEKIRSTDYTEVLTHYDGATGRWSDDYWQKVPFSGYYMVGSDWPGFALWICRTFKEDPIEKVEVGEVVAGKAKIMDRTGWPTVPYKLTLKDGRVLQGDLAFEYSAAGMDRPDAHWHGMEGIDWHYQYPNGLPKKP